MLCYNDWGIAVSEILLLAGTCVEREPYKPYYQMWKDGVTPEEAARRILEIPE
jgi:hypothetical protein